MKTNLITSLRFILLALVSVLCFSPVAATAYTSSGADGLFQPTASVVLDQPIYNFTSIYIPSGVTVSFGQLSSAQPIELLASGNIDIAGTLDMGANSLWLETTGVISFSGSLNSSSGGSLNLVAGNVNASGIFNIPSSSITINNGGNIITGGGNIILSPVPEPGVWAMLALGLFLIFAASRLRNQKVRLA